MGETPLVNCGSRSYSLHSIQFTAILVFYYFLANIFHSIRLILCYSKPVRLTTSLFRWGKVLWLCCAGSALAPESLVLRRITFRDHQPSTCFLAPTGSINLGFFLRENLPLCASYLPLGVPNGRVHLRASCLKSTFIMFVEKIQKENGQPQLWRSVRKRDDKHGEALKGSHSN